VRAVWTWFKLKLDGGRVVGGYVRIPGAATQNKSALDLPLTGELLAVVDRRWQQRIASSPYVFHTDGVPRPRFEKSWRAAAAAIGMPGLLFHDLRRSGARALRRAGVPESVIMRMGGWKTRAMLDRYSIVDDADVVDAQARLDRVLASPETPTVTALRPARR
jgi:integrase